MKSTVSHMVCTMCSFVQAQGDVKMALLKELLHFECSSLFSFICHLIEELIHAGFSTFLARFFVVLAVEILYHLTYYRKKMIE